MSRLQMVAAHCKIIPTAMLWAELMADTDSNAAAVRVCAELRLRQAM